MMKIPIHLLILISSSYKVIVASRHHVLTSHDVTLSPFKFTTTRTTVTASRSFFPSNHHHVINNNNNITYRSKRIIHLPRGGGGDIPNSSTFWSTRTSKPTNSNNIHNNSNPSNTFQVEKDDLSLSKSTSTTTTTTTTTKETIDAFLTRDNRNTFIARVYSILTGQLIITGLSIITFAKHPNIAKSILFSSKGQFVQWSCLIITTITSIIMAMSETARQQSPMKWIFLSIFTFGEAFLVGMISSLYKSSTVIMAISSTLLALISVTTYTILNKNPKYDLSQWGSSLYSSLIIFIFYGCIHLLSLMGIRWIPPGLLPYHEMVYSMIGAILFTCYLAYHTRLIVSGKHTKYQLNQKDYVFGAVLLYTDLVDLFLYLLRILGDQSNDD